MQHTSPRHALLLAAITVGTAGAAAFAFGGCGDAVAGPSTTRTPPVEAFHGLRVGGAFDVTVTPAAAHRVVLRGPAEHLERVTVRVTDGVLEIGHADRGWTVADVAVEVFTPRLAQLDVSGAVTLVARDLSGPTLRVEASGASDLTLAGAVDRLALEVSGASDVKALGLRAKTVAADVSGASDVKVRAEDRLEVEASGASDVRYAGEPATVDADRSGASDVEAI